MMSVVLLLIFAGLLVARLLDFDLSSVLGTVRPASVAESSGPLVPESSREPLDDEVVTELPTSEDPPASPATADTAEAAAPESPPASTPAPPPAERAEVVPPVTRAEPRQAPATQPPAPVSQPPRATPPAAPSADVTPGTLSIQSYPWGSVYIDGAYVGTTPLLGYRIPAGNHVLRVERPEYEPYVEDLVVLPGQSLRLTGIVLSRGGG
jgi:hypothetical protein